MCIDMSAGNETNDSLSSVMHASCLCREFAKGLPNWPSYNRRFPTMFFERWVRAPASLANFDTCGRQPVACMHGCRIGSPDPRLYENKLAIHGASIISLRDTGSSRQLLSLLLKHRLRVPNAIAKVSSRRTICLGHDEHIN